MLSPALKNLSEEDSSDPESGLALEPETDRFGFIVTSRSTVGNVGPAPELVRQREAKWIDIMGQWNHILLKKTSKVKVQCQKGIPASLRAKCWPLLCGATDRMKKNEDLYKFLDSQPALQSWVDVIERDLGRQFPFHEMFQSKDGHGQRGLFEVLKAYTQYKPNEGYCQAQGPVAAVLLMNMPAEEAFWCLVQICEQYLPGYYNPLLEGVLFDATLLMWVLKRTCPAAHKHLQHHGVEPLMFATDWLMCLFTRHLPFNMLLRVWDLFFCHGVRVLLQVAVELVRRVLGRAEQRKQCQGQLETLERLRAVKEQVQEEDDAFIAEVCAVPLSSKDLEKRTEKELDKWRKDRPTSTFDPRKRCLGYQMAWATTLHNHEEQEREKMERGNLSAPLSRSSSTLSLSFIPNNRRRKGGKGNADEWESSGRVVRHVSMGAKDEHRSWSDVRFMNKRDVQEEDVIFKECIQQSESLTVHMRQNESKLVDNINNITEHKVQEVKKGTEKEETNMTEERSQYKEPEEPVVLEQTGKINAETLPSKPQTLEDSLKRLEGTTQDHQELDSENLSVLTQQQTKDQTLKGTECTTQDEQGPDSDTRAAPTQGQTYQQTPEHSLQTTECANQCQHGLDSQSQVLEEQKHSVTDEKIEIKNQSAVTGKQMVERAVEEAQTGIQKHDNTETNQQQETEEDVQQTQEEMVTEIPDGFSDLITDVKVPSVKNLSAETGQQEITEDNLEGAAVEGQNSSTEATLQHTCTEEEGHIQNVTDATELTQQESTEVKSKVTNDVQDDEGSQTDKEDSQADVDTCKILTEGVGQEETQAEEEQIQMDEETSEAGQTEVTSCDEENNRTTEAGGERDPSDVKSPEEPASNAVRATVCANERSQESVSQNTAEERDVFTSPESPDPFADVHPDIKSQESPLMNEQHELKKTQAQSPSRRSSKSSGDFCIRRPSTSRGSKMGRRLSEDLFTVPQKPSTQSQSTSCHHDESQSSPVAVNPTQNQPDLVEIQGANLSQSDKVAEKVEPQQVTSGPQKRFGLFRRLKAEQPKGNKAKGRPKMQVPKILIQDFSDGAAGLGTDAEPDGEEKLSSRERRRRREQERRLKEEERLRKKREKELEKVMQQEKKKLQARGKSLHSGSEEKLSNDKTQQAHSGSQTNIHVTSYAESYF